MSVPHISIGSLPEMRDRTITVSGLSKTYSMTGWRLGYVIAPEYLANAIRKMHDFLTVGAPHPLQQAGVVALQLGQEYYRELVKKYDENRKLFLGPVAEGRVSVLHPRRCVLHHDRHQQLRLFG